MEDWSTARAFWAETAERYFVDDETLAATQEALDMGLMPLSSLSVPDGRKMLEKLYSHKHRVAFDGKIEDQQVPSSVTKGYNIPVTVYKPSSSSAVSTIVLYFHGGGLIYGDNKKMYENSLKTIAKGSAAVIIYVEYRLLPECADTDPMAPFNDAVDVTNWALQNKTSLGGQAKTKVGVLGDSAGGLISLYVSDIIKDVRFQALVYSWINFDQTEDQSCQEFASVPAFNTKAMQHIIKIVNPLLSFPGNNPRLNPAIRENVASSPPTLVVVGQLDPLRDSNVDYAGKLKKSGVDTRLVLMEGLPHGFFSAANFVKANVTACTHIVRFIKSIN
ncbi:carboxylesterase NlhH [Aplysia californica]|uniref:Carboxylesterase NlhH n=1 Tax=Aplysia californica TaxID=6500 RepID=A0ABM0JAD9_APLCA|nr:carboxylesterase NlhH [Aplysia californica]